MGAAFITGEPRETEAAYKIVSCNVLPLKPIAKGDNTIRIGSVRW